MDLDNGGVLHIYGDLGSGMYLGNWVGMSKWNNRPSISWFNIIIKIEAPSWLFWIFYFWLSVTKTQFNFHSRPYYINHWSSEFLPKLLHSFCSRTWIYLYPLIRLISIFYRLRSKASSALNPGCAQPKHFVHKSCTLFRDIGTQRNSVHKRRDFKQIEMFLVRSCKDVSIPSSVC